MIVTISTVKDRLANVQRFVRGNLAGGADHLIVFLDAADAEVEAWLAEQEHVSVIVTDETWWGEKRPVRLNKRQIINANLAKAALADCGWGEWLFHIDSDEVVQLDRTALAAVPRRRTAVRLKPLEVVSELVPDGDPTLFKRLLEEDELELLCALGLIAEPTNSLYFRSYVAGKVGVRPGSDAQLVIHKVLDGAGTRVPNSMLPGLEVLHFESYSGEEFVRKWSTMIGSGPGVHFGAHRARVAAALRCVLDSDLEAAAKDEILTRLYVTHMQDDVATLSTLAFLREVDVSAPGATPRSTPTQGDHLREALERLRAGPKGHFHALEADAKSQGSSERSGGARSGGKRRFLGR